MKEQLKLSKVVRDGFLIIVAGPGNEEGEEEPGEREGRVGLLFVLKNLIDLKEKTGWGFQFL